MRITVFSTKGYDRRHFEAVDRFDRHDIVFVEDRLRLETASFAKHSDAVCVFVHDEVDAEVLKVLSGFGCKFVVLRCAGYNNVDLKTAGELGMTVARVPAYSPYAVAEFAVGLILSLNRKYHRAYVRVREHDFSIDGLEGFDLHRRTVGVVGTGKIGAIFGRIMKGFGCEILAFDPYRNEEVAEFAEYVDWSTLLKRSDILSLHCPLTPETHHLINSDSLGKMKRGIMIVNTSRGALIDAEAAIEGVKTGVIGHLGLDVYEEEEGIFFEDVSDQIIQDDRLIRLTSFPNVLVTSHQAFFTREALENISRVTFENFDALEKTGDSPNSIHSG